MLEEKARPREMLKQFHQHQATARSSIVVIQINTITFRVTSARLNSLHTTRLCIVLSSTNSFPTGLTSALTKSLTLLQTSQLTTPFSIAVLQK